MYRFSPDIPVAQFMLDIKKNRMFSLRTVTNPSHDDDDDRQYLSVFLDPANFDPMMLPDAGSNYRLLDRFFVLPTANGTEQGVDESSVNWEMASTGDVQQESQISADLIRELYQHLREAHSKQTFKVVVDDKDTNRPAGLVPELRFYQMDAVNWMLSRERNTQFFPLEFVEIPMRNDPSKRFLFNEITSMLFDKSTVTQFPIPTGGILADEMGLGKTVEMLALILTNRRQLEANQDCGPVYQSAIGKKTL